MKFSPGVIFVGGVLAALLGASCGGKGEAPGKPGGPPGPGGRGPAAFPVDVAPVETRRVEYTIGAVGSVEAFERVQVTARVSGVVEKVLFYDGQWVQAGQPLVEIELARFQLAVKAARATLDKVEVNRADAEAGLARREKVAQESPGLITGEELETFRSKVASLGAEVAQARVAVEQAELNLRDASVRALVGGPIQTRTVQTGQYVQPGTILATLLRRDPLLLRFQVPDHEATQLKLGLKARFRVPGDEHEFSARVSHVAAAADPGSRMVPVTAVVDDARKSALRPGAFAQVTVGVGGSIEAPVVPQIAVRPSERGFLAYVVEDGVARERLLQLGLRTTDGRVEVRSGLRPGEILVVRGAEALRDGSPVKTSEAPGAPAAPVQAADPKQPEGKPRRGTP